MAQSWIAQLTKNNKQFLDQKKSKEKVFVYFQIKTEFFKVTINISRLTIARNSDQQRLFQPHKQFLKIFVKNIDFYI